MVPEFQATRPMKLRVRIGEELSPLSVPDCQVALAPGFLEALQCVAEFTGAGSRWFPWTRYVYLADGKLYASDNHCLVEIDLHDSSLGPARLSRQDIAIIRKMGGSPQRALVAEHEIAFAWDRQRWASFDIDLTGFEFVSRCRALLNEFWHEGAPVSAELRAAADGLGGTKSADELVDLSPPGDRGQQVWYRGAIAKVLRVAQTFAPESTPAPFGFPGGRGLIVNPGIGIVGPYQDGFFYHSGGTGTKEVTRRILGGEGFNPYLDDIFALPIQDTKDLLRSNDTRKGTLLKKASPDAAQLAFIDAQNAELIARLQLQHDAITRFQLGEQLDQEKRDLLRPRADLLAARLKRRRKKANSEDEEVEESPEAKRDKILMALPREIVEERIERAFAPYFEQSFKRDMRVQYWNRLGSLRPIPRSEK